MPRLVQRISRGGGSTFDVMRVSENAQLDRVRAQPVRSRRLACVSLRNSRRGPVQVAVRLEAVNRLGGNGDRVCHIKSKVACRRASEADGVLPWAQRGVSAGRCSSHAYFTFPKWAAVDDGTPVGPLCREINAKSVGRERLEQVANGEARRRSRQRIASVLVLPRRAAGLSRPSSRVATQAYRDAVTISRAHCGARSGGAVAMAMADGSGAGLEVVEALERSSDDRRAARSRPGQESDRLAWPVGRSAPKSGRPSGPEV